MPLFLLTAVLIAGCGEAEHSGGTTSHLKVAARPQPTDFGAYPAQIFAGPLAFPDEQDWPDPNWRENSAARINFAGHFTHVIINCGMACTSDWIVDRKDGRMIRAPKGRADVEPLAIDTRSNSNLMKITWISSRHDGSGEVFPPCFAQHFVWTGASFREVAARTEIACPPQK